MLMDGHFEGGGNECAVSNIMDHLTAVIVPTKHALSQSRKAAQISCRTVLTNQGVPLSALSGVRKEKETST
jgi:hypothetical protein